MRAPADLTRWNRAGLRRFRYVRGNAADFLERLRLELWKRMGDRWTALRRDPEGDPAEERSRVLGQYFGERRDVAWEIARAFARASHVLAEHVDAFANEGYLETATQWDLLRRLVEMLGYHPAPPASASTVLALTARPGPAGKVEAGLQVKSAPVDGSAPVVFETLADVAVDARLDALRLAGWNRAEDGFSPWDSAGASLWRAEEGQQLSTGQPALVLEEKLQIARATALEQVDPVSGEVRLSPPGGASGSWTRGATVLLAGPRGALRPRLNGPGLVELDRPHGLGAGEVVAWSSGGAWALAAVAEAEGNALRLADAAARPGGNLYRAPAVAPLLDRTTGRSEPEFRTPLTLLAAGVRKAAGSLELLLPGSFSLQPSATGPQYLWTRAGGDEVLHVVLSGAPPVGAVVAPSALAGSYRFGGSPGGLGSGAWVVAEYRTAGGVVHRRAAEVVRLEVREGEFDLVLRDGEPAGMPAAIDRRLQALLQHLRRVEAALDQPLMQRIRLGDLAQGLLGREPASAVEGVGPRGARPPSYADRLTEARVRTVAELAALPPERAVPGVPPTMLRQLRTRAELLVGLPGELRLPADLLGKTLAELVHRETGAAPLPSLASLSLVRLYGPFRHWLRPPGHDRNQRLVDEGGRLVLELSPAELPSALKVGRLLVLEQEEGGAAHQATLEELDTSGTLAAIRLAPPLPRGAGFTLGNTVIRANAVRAGHGEAKAERALGSGAAARVDQEFVLEVSRVSFVADSSMPAGVRADVTVRVDEEIWKQVASLRGSRPADAHYTVRLTEEGFLRFGFGDGQNGRRLPTGTNNVRIRYRLGAGRSGNLRARSLEKLARPHALVTAVRQPLPALGGSDLEGVEALRANAPASMLSLERAVALGDYGNLATRQAAVWQARAFRRPGWGRSERVEVVVVPVGGAPLAGQLRPQIPPYLLEEQRLALLRHAPPGVEVSVHGFEAVLVSLRANVWVRSAAWEPAEVVERVRRALGQAFGLEQRRLGQPLQRSEVYRVVEEVEGVENSDCVIELLAVAGAPLPRRVVRKVGAAGPVIESVVPLDRQVVHVDPDRSTVRVSAAEYEP